MEQKIRVETFLIHYYCDDCNSRTIRDVNRKRNFNTDPIQLPYICPNCSKTYVLSEDYPKVMYEWYK